MKTTKNKSSFNKLYLIQPEIYDRVIPYLNEVEKQEQKDLQEKNCPFEENDQTFEEKNEEQKNDNAEEVNDDAEEVDDDVIMDPLPENEEVNIGSPATPVEEPKIDKPKISVKMVKKPNGDWSIKKTREKKVKNFSCEICVNKKFTTKRSLERHDNTFHVEKHSIKGAQVIPEVRYPNTTSPETVKAKPETVEAEGRKSRNLKRKFEYNPGEFHLERDNQRFSRDEPVNKRPKGVDSKVPKLAKVLKRKLNDDTNDF